MKDTRSQIILLCDFIYIKFRIGRRIHNATRQDNGHVKGERPG